MSSLRPEALTWTALLGRWIEYAQASIALPDDADGRRWRAAVPHVINLQAVTFALGELGGLPREERALGRDKAAIIIREATQELESIWGEAPLPDEVAEMICDAGAALHAAAYAGATELVVATIGPFVMPDVEPGAPRGTLALAAPGTILMPGEPAGWWLDREGFEVDGCEPAVVTTPRQVYRELDDDGTFRRDLVAPVTTDPPDDLRAMPLIVPLFDRDERIGGFPLDREEWLRRQQAAMTGRALPVERLEEVLAASR